MVHVREIWAAKAWRPIAAVVKARPDQLPVRMTLVLPFDETCATRPSQLPQLQHRRYRLRPDHCHVPSSSISTRGPGRVGSHSLQKSAKTSLHRPRQEGGSFPWRQTRDIKAATPSSGIAHAVISLPRLRSTNSAIQNFAADHL